MTEKDYNPNQKEKKAMGKQLNTNKKVEPMKKVEKKEEEKIEKKSEAKNKKLKKADKKKAAPEKPKKYIAKVNVKDLPISTKHSVAICRFIKKKKIGDAITDLEQVLVYKKAVPMKGEIPHRKGKGMMSGRFPQKAVKSFIKLLKSLAANATYEGVEEPIITDAIANLASRPFGRFGRERKKRTHVTIIAKTKKKKVKKEKE